ncbi:MAG: ankyrin repeat domain-containing protein [Phycisphaerales bacterium]|nr:ankyrin repeat domain-containing protein [Phycisphaerales bacterium]
MMGSFPLFYMACYDRVPISVIHELLVAGVDATQATRDGDTPMLYACRSGFLRIVRVLLDFQPSLAHFPGPNGELPLCAAAAWGKVNVLLELLRRGADPNRTEPGSRWTAIHYAASFGTIRCVRALLAHGAKVPVGPRGPAAIAQRHGRARTARLLSQLESGPHGQLRRCELRQRAQQL